MADMSPMGTATNMAMAETSRVPVNSGTAPKAPEAPTWSARMAVWGLHRVPKKNSRGETFWKKSRDSNRTDSTIPRVVRIAIDENTIMIPSTMDSTRLRARICGLVWRTASAMPPRASPSTRSQRA